MLNYLAEVYGRRGELDRAAAMLERSLRVDPEQVAPTMTLALVQHMLDRGEAALATADRGHALNERTRQDDLIVEKLTGEICRARCPARARVAWERYIGALRALPDASSPRIAGEITYAERQLAGLR